MLKMGPLAETIEGIIGEGETLGGRCMYSGWGWTG